MAHANTEQVIAAWSTLDERDKLILRKMGSTLIGGTRFSEPLDLMHEALIRCLDGRRHWPIKVNFSVFVGNVMRSIAHGERRSSKRDESSRIEFGEFMERLQHVSTAPSAEDEVSDAQQIRVTRKAADDLRLKLDGDECAQKALSGLVAGLSPKEMRESFHIDDKAFEAAFQRVVRRAKAARMH